MKLTTSTKKRNPPKTPAIRVDPLAVAAHLESYISGKLPPPYCNFLNITTEAGAYIAGLREFDLASENGKAQAVAHLTRLLYAAASGLEFLGALPAASAGVALSPEQLALLIFVRKHIAANTISPSFREMMAGLGYNSTGPVDRMLKKLQEQGFMEKGDGSRRSLRITPKGMAVREPAA